jgi:hypothetical protein
MYSYYDTPPRPRDNPIDQITDRIFLGGIPARSKDLLTKHDIKHVIGLLAGYERVLIATERKIVRLEPEFRIDTVQEPITCSRHDNVPVAETLYDLEDSPRSRILPLIATIKEYVDRVAPERVLSHGYITISNRCSSTFDARWA